ncbi:MAG: hypothetical protein D8M59_08030 [Planctomycetes bacterium]|nr:hypothetical protein [Planctomycetota bacterium]NOG53272.1 hypothetical protein [Planctomycetota bacterium]
MAQISRTFSELWYRVADFTPRLSPHLNVRRHTYRNETWFVLGDPASSKFYRFNAAAFRFLGLLDGTRTVQEAWDVCNAQLGDAAPTQQDCIDLLCQLQFYGLLKNELPIDAQRLGERFDSIKERKFQERSGRYVFWTIPLINPEWILEKYANVARAVFSPTGLVLLLVLLFFAIRAIIPRSDELFSAFNNIIAPQNIIWLSLSFICLKVIHEFGHGFACKAYGGRVTEMGLFFMIVLPIPFCDATASWGFPNKWHRIIVSLGGMMVELAVACIAAFVWAYTPAGALIHTIAYNVMFIASVATILFNLNPLLRYDGYYILADLLEIPNLAVRSQELLKYLTKRYAFGLKGEKTPPLRSKSEGAWMVTHAICAFPYRMLVMLTIVLVVADRYFVIGLLLGLFGSIVWFMVPVFKGFSFVISEPSLEVVRVRAVTVTFAFTIAVIGFFGFVPMPANVYASAVVEPLNHETLRSPFSGFVTNLSAADGEWVTRDQPLCYLFNPKMETQYLTAKSRLEVGQLRRDAALAESPYVYQLAMTWLPVARKYYEDSKTMLASMTIRAPFDGQFVAPDFHTTEGAYFQRGTPIGTVSTLDDMVIRAYLTDADIRWLFSVADDDSDIIAQARIYGNAGTVIPLEITSRNQAGSRTLEHPSLATGTRGGVIATDPTDPTGQRTLAPVWRVTLSMPSAASDANSAPDQFAAPLPGTRAVVRFQLEAEPLAQQWWRRILQSIRSRFEF